MLKIYARIPQKRNTGKLNSATKCSRCVTFLIIYSRLYRISLRKQDNFACLIRFFVLFQEKVKSVEGSREFLQALGFTSVMLPIEGQGK